MANSKRRSRRKLIVFGCIVALLIPAVLYPLARRKDVPITVQTEKVARRNLTETVVANGKVQPVLQVKISPEVSGEIIELPVKEGQTVKKGDLLLRIKPDFYEASRRSAEASYKCAVASRDLAAATLRKAELELQRNDGLFKTKLISDSAFVEVKTACEIARASHQSAEHQIEVARASLARAEEELAKTTIYAPITGTVSKLNSELGERVVGTAMMSGTEVMTIADLNEMEARVDIGEMDVVLIEPGQKTHLEVDAFRDRKFAGAVTEIANSSKTSPMGGQSQEATRFQVKIRILEKAAFRPGMSVTANVEARSRTNVLAVPSQSVTTRLPKKTKALTKLDTQQTNSGSATSNSVATTTNTIEGSKPGEAAKPIEVVFLKEGHRALMVPVKRGISDDKYTEIVEGLKEGQEVISGSYKAIGRELEDGKTVKVGAAEPGKSGEKEKQ